LHGTCFKIKNRHSKMVQVWFSGVSCGTKLGADYANYSFSFHATGIVTENKRFLGTLNINVPANYAWHILVI
jgi:hypothetical protein